MSRDLPYRQSKRFEYPLVILSDAECWAQIYQPNSIYQLLYTLTLPLRTVKPYYRAYIEEPPVDTEKKLELYKFMLIKSLRFHMQYLIMLFDLWKLKVISDNQIEMWRRNPKKYSIQ